MQVIAHNRYFGGQSNGINRRCALLSSLWEAAQNLECPQVFGQHGRIHQDVSITLREKLRPRKSSIDPDADESQQAMSWFTYLSNCFAPSPSGNLVELGGD
jgi:hypothetical protein